MSFYTSLSGLKAAQTDLSTISNNIANAESTGFKKSRAEFGDLFASAPTQTTKMVAGQGTHLDEIQQQFTQGTLQSTDKTLDLAIAGDGFFVVKGREVSYTRDGAFAIDPNRNVVDTTGAKLQLLPVDATGTVTSTAPGDLTNFVLPATATGNPSAALSNVAIDVDGLVTATFSDGSSQPLGKVAMASFTAMEGLRPVGDAHWQSTGDSGTASIGGANTGSRGAVRSGTLERANIDVTEELVALISAQRNFQANAKAIETAGTMTQTIFNIH